MRKMIVIPFAAALLFLISGGVWAQEEMDSPDRTGRHYAEFSTLSDHNTFDAAIGVPDPEQIIYGRVPDVAGDGLPKDQMDFGGENQVDARIVKNVPVDVSKIIRRLDHRRGNLHTIHAFDIRVESRDRQ